MKKKFDLLAFHWRWLFCFECLLLKASCSLLKEPKHCWVWFANLSKEYYRFWKHWWHDQKTDAFVALDPTDRRFKHPRWQGRNIFNYYKQHYLIFANALPQLFKKTLGLTTQEHADLLFMIHFFLEAIAPNNLLFTNPELIEQTKQEKGRNLQRGWRHFLADLDRWGGCFNVSKTSPDAFILGKTIATTPHTIIEETALYRLRYYETLSKELHQQPMLMIPPWMNQYYLFDLSPKKSLIAELLEAGHAVFVIDWKNPTQDYDYAEYIEQGVLRALTTITTQYATSVHAFAYCTGGALLACALAYLATQPHNPICSATYIAALIDYTYPGVLKPFMSAPIMAASCYEMAQKGYWDGRLLLTALSYTDPRNFVCPYFINRYWRGKTTQRIPSLYWAEDTIDVPVSLYKTYLYSMQRDNVFKNPGFLSIHGIPNDFNRITLPTYVVAFEQDPLTPWEGCYLSAQLHRGPRRFILATGDHITGILLAGASSQHYFYQNNTNFVDPIHWKTVAQAQAGPWGADWMHWLKEQSV